MSGVSDTVSEGRRRAMLRTAMGPTIAAALADPLVLELNREALARLTCEKELAVVPGATHLFEEPGALERVGELARSWFLAHLVPP